MLPGYAADLVVRGARVLATLAPFADELAVYPAAPMPEGADAYALSFCVSVSAPGLKFMCRDSVSAPANRFDHPLSSRFDEQDAFVIFDDVEIPRDRLFIDANVKVYNQTNTRSWHSNVMQQTMIRAATKLEFAWGLACRMADAIGASDPVTLQMLGELWSFAELARSAVHSAEEGSHHYGNGAWFLDGRPMDALRTATSLLSLYDPDEGDESLEANRRKALRLTARHLAVGRLDPACATAAHTRAVAEPFL